jgi:hypothetical protein
VAYSVRAADGAELGSGTLNPGENKLEGIRIGSREQLPVRVVAAGLAVPVNARFLPGWISILPPLFAIVLALVFREVVVSLFAGVWLGAFFWTGLNPLSAVLRTMDTFALPALADSDHAAIVIFSLLIGGMVGVIGRNGGTFGIVERLAPMATTPRRGLLATYTQGLAIFFDDYANTLIVGNTMRPVTDRLRVSREKLAYGRCGLCISWKLGWARRGPLTLQRGWDRVYLLSQLASLWQLCGRGAVNCKQCRHEPQKGQERSNVHLNHRSRQV